MKQLTKDQYWKLFKSLPDEMKDVIFSEKTAKDINDIGERNQINNISLLADCVSQVLFGVLLPNDLPKVLEEDLGLKKSQLSSVMQEINRFIFYPIKPLLEELYRTELTPIAKQETIPSGEERTAYVSSKDAYRETIE